MTSKNLIEFHSGKKLQLARRIRNFALKELADKFKVDPGTISSWQTKGIPESRLEFVADFFNVDLLIFTDRVQDRDIFKLAIKNSLEESKGSNQVPLKSTKPTTLYANDHECSTNDITMENIEKHIQIYHNSVLSSPKLDILINLFVPLNITKTNEYRVDIETDPFNLDGDLLDYKSLLDEYSYDESLRRYDNIPSNGEAIELMWQIQQMIIYGKPGSGKTTSLQMFCYESIISYKPGGIFFVYIPLIKFNFNDNLISFIAKESGIPEISITYLLKNNRLGLLLDSLNECLFHARENCEKEIRLLINEYNNLAICITSRPGYYFRYIDYPTFKIEPITKDKQRVFLKIHLKDLSLVETVLNQLYTQQAGEAICSNPWMLYMAAIIYRRNNMLPVKKTELFEYYIKTWVPRETQKEGKISLLPKWNESEYFCKLSQISAYMLINGYSKEAPVSWIKQYIGAEWLTIEEMLNTLTTWPICNINHIDNIFAFNHETLQEYFASNYIINNPNILLKVNPNDKESWYAIIADAIEIDSLKNEAFMKTAWLFCPQLVSILSSNCYQLSIHYEHNSSLIVKDIIRINFKNELTDNDFEEKLNDYDIKFLRCESIHNITKSNPNILKQIQKLTGYWLKYRLDTLLSLIEYYIISKNYISKNDLKSFLTILISDPHYGYRFSFFIERGFITRDDFSQIPQTLNTYLSNLSKLPIEDVMNLSYAKFISHEDILNNLFYWIKQKPSNYLLRKLIHHIRYRVVGEWVKLNGIDIYDFQELVPYRTSRYISKSIVKYFIYNDISAILDSQHSEIKTDEIKKIWKDFYKKMKNNNRRLDILILLISLNIITLEEAKKFKDNQILVDQSTPETAKILSTIGLTENCNFDERIPYWAAYFREHEVKDETIPILTDLIRLGIINCKNSISLLKLSTPAMANILIENELVTKEEYKKTIDDWIECFKS